MKKSSSWASYNGYYICLPSIKWGFDSPRPLQKKKTSFNIKKRSDILIFYYLYFLLFILMKKNYKNLYKV